MKTINIMNIIYLSISMRFVILLLALLGTAIAVAGRHERIMGGSPTTVEQYPFMSNMQFVWLDILWIQACGGALLTRRTVLSGARCYHFRSSPNQWNVRLGSSFASSGGDLHTVTQIIIHEDYNDNTLENDLAIVVLTHPALLSNTIAVARIPGNNYNLPAGTGVTAIGWGSLTPGSIGNFPEQLQHVDIYIVDHQLCMERYAYLKTQPAFRYFPDVTDGMVCAGVLGVGGWDACEGDDGSPLVYLGDIVYGVVSWGRGCGDPFYPGVNTRVSHYSNWVVEYGSV